MNARYGNRRNGNERNDSERKYSERWGGGRSRAALFLMEQVIVIAVFTVCAAACIKIYMGSYRLAGETRDMSRALAIVKNAAECYKVYGSPGKTAAALGSAGTTYGAPGAPYSVVTYDAGGQVCDWRGAVYTLYITERPVGNEALSLCRLLVLERFGGGLVELNVAARRDKRNE